MDQSWNAGYDRRMEDWLPPVGDSSFRVWGSPSLPTLGAILARDHIHEYPAHIHDCVELIWIHSGRANFICRGVCYSLMAGDLCMIAPNELHKTNVPTGERCTFTIIHVPSNLYWPHVQAFARKGKGEAPGPLHVIRADAIHVPLVGLLESLVYSNACDQISAQLSDLLEATLQAAPRYNGFRPDGSFWHPAVMHARETLSDCSEEAVNIQDMACEVGLNMRYFISLFKNGTGMSPHQYQIALRVDRARYLLQDKKAPLCEVAVSAGFSDQSHLNRHFKRSYGFTPGGFRQILCHI